MSTLPCVSFIMQPTVTEHTGKQRTTFIRCDAAGPLAVKIGISAVPVGEWEMMQTEWSCLSWPYVTPARLWFVSSEGERGKAAANKGIKLSKKDTAYIRFPKSIKQLSFLCLTSRKMTCRNQNVIGVWAESTFHFVKNKRLIDGNWTINSS